MRRPGRARQRIAGITLLGALVMGGAISGCEALLDTSDLHDREGGADATTSDGAPGDDDDDASFDAGDADALPGSDAGPNEAGSGDGGPSEAGVPQNPSCVNSAARYTCGAQQNDDCCSVGRVSPAGAYERTYDSGTVGNPGSYEEIVSPFALDTYEVTVGRFREYVHYLQGGGLPPASGSGVHTYLNVGASDGPGLLIDPTFPFYEPGWASQDNGNLPIGADAGATWSAGGCAGTYSAAPTGGENLPMTCVTWYEAYAFCIWDGGYLPSEGEWEYAAADGSSERKYPWGSADPGVANAYAQFDCINGDCPAIVGAAALGADAFGHFDMMGNAAEWTLDDYVPYDDPSQHTTLCQDCLNYDYTNEGTNGEQKVSRGGAYLYNLGDPALYPPGRSSFAPTTRLGYLGLRCGRNPAP